MERTGRRTNTSLHKDLSLLGHSSCSWKCRYFYCFDSFKVGMSKVYPNHTCTLPPLYPSGSRQFPFFTSKFLYFPGFVTVNLRNVKFNVTFEDGKTYAVIVALNH